MGGRLWALCRPCTMSHQGLERPGFLSLWVPETVLPRCSGPPPPLKVLQQDESPAPPRGPHTSQHPALLPPGLPASLPPLGLCPVLRQAQQFQPPHLHSPFSSSSPSGLSSKAFTPKTTPLSAAPRCTPPAGFGTSRHLFMIMVSPHQKRSVPGPLSTGGRGPDLRAP